MRRLTSSLLILPAALALSFVARAQSDEPSDATQPGTAKSQNAIPAKNLSGTWALRAPRGVPWYNYALIGDEPPMTPWAEAKFKANKPSFGPHPVEESNDPAYSCLPNGVPRIYAAVQAAFQFVELPDRMLMFIGRSIRQIYTDGRPHPADLQPTWMGALDRQVGWRHICRRYSRHQRCQLARSDGPPAQRQAAPHRTFPAGGRQDPAAQPHHRRSDRLHQDLGCHAENIPHQAGRAGGRSDLRRHV